jgi:hypothetical protein
MDQEKEKEFKVTDKRSAFREESSEPSKEEPQDTKSESSQEPQEPQREQPTDESSSIPFPEANFMTLVFSLYTHAQISLGIVPDPITQQTTKELPQAKYNIDLLGILKEKTQGNLTSEEEQALEQILYELRMIYIEVSKQ